MGTSASSHINSSGNSQTASKGKHHRLCIGCELLYREVFNSKFTGQLKYRWRKVEVRNITDASALLHFTGWSEEYDKEVNLLLEEAQFAPIGLLNSDEVESGAPLSASQLSVTHKFISHGIRSIAGRFNNLTAQDRPLELLGDCLVGQKIDVQDLYRSKSKDVISKWRPAEIIEAKGSLVRVHFIGWESKWDTVIDLSTSYDRVRRSTGILRAASSSSNKNEATIAEWHRSSTEMLIGANDRNLMSAMKPRRHSFAGTDIGAVRRGPYTDNKATRRASSVIVPVDCSYTDFPREKEEHGAYKKVLFDGDEDEYQVPIPIMQDAVSESKESYGGVVSAPGSGTELTGTAFEGERGGCGGGDVSFGSDGSSRGRKVKRKVVRRYSSSSVGLGSPLGVVSSTFSPHNNSTTTVVPMTTAVEQQQPSSTTACSSAIATVMSDDDGNIEVIAPANIRDDDRIRAAVEAAKRALKLHGAGGYSHGSWGEESRSLQDNSDGYNSSSGGASVNREENNVNNAGAVSTGTGSGSGAGSINRPKNDSNSLKIRPASAYATPPSMRSSIGGYYCDTEMRRQSEEKEQKQKQNRSVSFSVLRQADNDNSHHHLQQQSATRTTTAAASSPANNTSDCGEYYYGYSSSRDRRRRSSSSSSSRGRIDTGLLRHTYPLPNSEPIIRRNSTGTGSSFRRPSLSQDTFIERLDHQGMQVVTVEADGNCLFRAASFLIYGTEERYNDLRQLCAEHMERHKERFSLFCSSDIEKHLNRVRKDKVRGSELEIRALEEVLDRVIIVYSCESVNGEMTPVPVHINTDELRLLNGIAPIRLAYQDPSTSSTRNIDSGIAGIATYTNTNTGIAEEDLNVNDHCQYQYNAVVDETQQFPLGERCSNVLETERVRMYTNMIVEQ